MEFKLLGKNYQTQDLVAKVTGQAKYAEDFRAEGMVFVKLMPSPRPHAKIRSIDASAALAMPGVHGILTAKDLPAAPAPRGRRLPLQVPRQRVPQVLLLPAPLRPLAVVLLLPLLVVALRHVPPPLRLPALKLRRPPRLVVVARPLRPHRPLVPLPRRRLRRRRCRPSLH